LPAEGVVFNLPSDVDPWAKKLGRLPLTGTKTTDSRYPKHQDDRGALRRQINSGARCTTLPQNRRFKVRAEDGVSWRVVPFEKAAARQFESLASLLCSRVTAAVDACEQDLSVAIANDDASITADEIRKIKGMQFEMSLIRNAATHFASNIAARVAHATPEMNIS
jgi:hypothetical protein